MAAITTYLYEIEDELENMLLLQGVTLPRQPDMYNIVDHLNYIISLLGKMMPDDALSQVLKSSRDYKNNIADRAHIISRLLASGQIAGKSQVDLEQLTVFANGLYTAESGTAYDAVTVEVPYELETSSENISVVDTTLVIEDA